VESGISTTEAPLSMDAVETEAAEEVEVSWLASTMGLRGCPWLERPSL
jgi:hypothetical protein